MEGTLNPLAKIDSEGDNTRLKDSSLASFCTTIANSYERTKRLCIGSKR
jgi:hypothetical protein